MMVRASKKCKAMRKSNQSRARKPIVCPAPKETGQFFLRRETGKEGTDGGRLVDLLKNRSVSPFD
jgi:hypothetical protein